MSYLYNDNLFLLKPKVAIVSGESDFLIASVDDSIELVKFNHLDELINEVSLAYDTFLTHLENYGYETLNELLPYRPFSVALIEINKENLLERLLCCERLQSFQIQALAFSDLAVDDLIIQCINQGCISGYLSKSCDMFDEFIPTILHQNKRFYHCTNAVILAQFIGLNMF